MKASKERIGLVLVILIAAFLRFYNLEKWQFFTYDQARDYLIVKKLILDRKFTLVGPTVLAPGVYLPPFYYYSIAPFLWAFRFRLIGPDIYTALLGVASLGIFFLVAKDLFGKKVALFSSLFFAFNPYLIHTSRHAWNPNTIYFFTLIFVLSFERFLLKKKFFWLYLAAFSISLSLNLHYTALVWLPLLGYMFFLEYKRNGFGWNIIGAGLSFLIFVSPLFIFDLRHNFPNLKGVIDFWLKQPTVRLSPAFFLSRIKFLILDFVKIPVVFLSGLNRNENISVNPSHIVLFDKVNILANLSHPFLRLKFFVGLGTFFLSLWVLVKEIILKKKLEGKMMVWFLFFGFLIKLIFPPASFYFYHYTFLFPVILLCFSYFIFSVSEKLGSRLTFLLLVMWAVLPFLPEGLRTEVRNQDYFLSTAKIVANDYQGGKVAIAANLADPFRWDHNGLEYRYFLESFYRLPLGGWDVEDYKQADILYLIDEGDLPDPLKLKGMEMEAFGPKKIEKFWQAESGQKIYRLTK